MRSQKDAINRRKNNPMTNSSREGKCGRCFDKSSKVARLCRFTKAEQGRLVMLLLPTVAIQLANRESDQFV